MYVLREVAGFLFDSFRPSTNCFRNSGEAIIKDEHSPGAGSVSAVLLLVPPVLLCLRPSKEASLTFPLFSIEALKHLRWSSWVTGNTLLSLRIQ